MGGVSGLAGRWWPVHDPGHRPEKEEQGVQLQKSLWNHSGQAGSELEPMWSPLGSMWSRFGHAWNQFGRVGNQFGRVWNQFGNDERGQDMVEYTMLLAFVCLAAAALVTRVRHSL